MGFSKSSHTSDLKIGTQVAALPGAWCYRLIAGTGRPGVNILWLGEVESLIWKFCPSVAARKIVCADLSGVNQLPNKQTDQQFFSRCGSMHLYLSRFVPETHLSEQPRDNNKESYSVIEKYPYAESKQWGSSTVLKHLYHYLSWTMVSKHLNLLIHPPNIACEALSKLLKI